MLSDIISILLGDPEDAIVSTWDLGVLSQHCQAFSSNPLEPAVSCITDFGSSSSGPVLE